MVLFAMVLSLWAAFRPARVSEDLTGVVLAPEGGHVPDSFVVLVYTCSSCSSRHDRQVECDCDGAGEFRFERPVDHPALITAFAPGLVSVPIEFHTSAVPPEVHDLSLVPEARLTGTLLDGDGTPMRQRRIEVWSPALVDANEGVTTDLAGGFEITRLPPGRTKLIVWPTEAETARLGSGVPADLVWQAAIRALFVDLSPGQRVEVDIPQVPERLVQVKASVKGRIDQVYVLMATRTDNEALEYYDDYEGAFLLGPGLYRLSLSLSVDRHMIMWRTQLEVPDAPSFEFEWPITFGDLHGVVRGPDGTAAPHAEIFWTPDDGLEGALSWSLSTSSADGSFEVHRLPAGPQQLCARSGAKLSRWTRVQVVQGEIASVQLALE